jgi:hypothetical protein
MVWEMMAANLLDIPVLCFFLGMAAVFCKSPLHFPSGVHDFFAVYLLFALGLKGGVQLSRMPLSVMLWPAIGTLAIAVITPLHSFVFARFFGRMERHQAAALAAHYGSVSVVTFMAAQHYTEMLGLGSHPMMTVLTVLLEVPAIIIALALAQPSDGTGNLGPAVAKVLRSKSVVLLLGGVLVGYLGGAESFQKVKMFFQEPFYGFLSFFLLEMGVIAAERLSDLRRFGRFIVIFGTVVPMLHGALGVCVGWLVGMDIGSTVVLAALAASASYIAAPAAVRMVLPHLSPTMYLASSLGVTFPFNIAIGLGLYHALALRIFSYGSY